MGEGMLIEGTEKLQGHSKHQPLPLQFNDYGYYIPSNKACLISPTLMI